MTDRLTLIQEILALTNWDEQKRLRAIHLISDLRRGEPYLSAFRGLPVKLPEPGQGDGRTCSREGCDKPILRSYSESAKGWQVRRYCSRRCAALCRRGAERRAALAANDNRPCGICGAKIEPRPHERPSKYATRRTCSPRCRGALAYANRAQRGKKEKVTLHSSLHPEKALSPRRPPAERRLPDPRPKSDYQPGVMTADPKLPRCETHPHETVGAYGCPACNAGRQRRDIGAVRRPQGETRR